MLAGKATACFIAVITVIAIMVALGTWLGMRPESPLTSRLGGGVHCLLLRRHHDADERRSARSEEAVSGAAWGANMLMAMFGGGMIPLVFMPSFMRTLSDFSPAKWSVLVLEGSIWRGFTFAEMLTPCVVLLSVGAVCLAIGGMILSRVTD